jgi:hypothetical protein
MEATVKERPFRAALPIQKIELAFRPWDFRQSDAPIVVIVARTRR